MESRFRVLFLIVAIVSLPGCAATKNLFGFGDEEAPPLSAEEPGQVIDPQVERREIKPADIDTEDFELGGYVGFMSVEDFGTNAVYGATLAYHVSEHWFVQGTYGQTDTEETSFEILSEAVLLNQDEVASGAEYGLVEIARLALEQNQLLQAEEFGTQAGVEEVARARSIFLPQVDASASNTVR